MLLGLGIGLALSGCAAEPPSTSDVEITSVGAPTPLNSAGAIGGFDPCARSAGGGLSISAGAICNQLLLLPELDRRRLVRLPTSRRGSRGAMTAGLARRRKIAGPGNEIVRKHRRKPSTGG
jgi:hypothetical protein